MTPIVKIDLLDSHNTIYIKREDLLPFSFGGNKVRIAQEFVQDMKNQGKNCIIGYGNARSNLSRALANLCFSENIPCCIISPSDDDGNRIETSNSLLVKKFGVTFFDCSKSNVAETVEKVIHIYEGKSLKPYYIYGDKYGNGNEAVPLEAYKKVYGEIARQAETAGILFDYIFLATGTGMTQAGLILGKQAWGGVERIIGISISRNTNTETEVIKKYLKAYKKANSISSATDYDIVINDDYIFGGYGISTPELDRFIWDFFSKYGIPLDPTYTGKAFYGTLDFLKKNEISGKNILFIHTGGTPLFFDFVNTPPHHHTHTTPYSTPHIQIVEVEYTELEKVISFLKDVDALFPTPLSKRVKLEQYASKVLKYGKILAVKKHDKIVAAIFFYCNNLKTKSSYITLLGALTEYQTKGYASALLKAAEEISISNHMIRCKTETEFSNSKAIVCYLRNGYNVEFVNTKLHVIKELIKPT